MDRLSRHELLRRAAQLVPVLKERAAKTEELRQIPPESVRDLLDSTLIRIGNPERYGGHGLEMDTAYDASFELGRGCGSTAWCYSLWTAHNWWLGHFPEKCQDEFFATGPDTLFSSGLNPSGGRVEPVAGGFRVAGRWGFSSGCDAATWAMVAVTGARAGSLMWLLLPRPDYEIVDTWFAAGMRGSGSKDVVIKDAFVPARRAIDPERAGADEKTGWEIHARLSYRVPLRCMAGWDLAAPLVGIAQGAIDEFTSRLLRTSGPGRTADSVALQLRLAEAAAEVDAARALHRAAIAEIMKREGVEFLSTYPTTPIIDAAAAAGIRPVLCRQERVGVGIADGFSRTTNGRRLGVFAMQYGPGAENAFSGVATAYSDSVPMLVLPLGHQRDRAQVFPLFSSAKTYASVTKWVETLNQPEQVNEVMRRAFNLLKMGRPGPVMVEIPADVAVADCGDLALAYK